MTHRRVIDAHLHLDEKISGRAHSAARALDEALAEASIAKGVVLHLATQRWPVEEVAEAIAATERLVGCINIHPFQEGAIDALNRGIKELGFIGLKLHPRLQKYSIDDQRTHALIREAGALSVPVIIDAFPDGDWIMQGFDPVAFARLCKACPTTRIVVAHLGGHHAIDCMMLAKRLPNMHFDFSYSLLYFRGSSVTTDLTYVMRSMRFKRIFYGSDYPDRAVKDTLAESLAILEQAGFGTDEIDRVLYGNAKDFFGCNDV
jgi:predicted TIM-barrel fold metal-dependent hydrolase